MIKIITISGLDGSGKSTQAKLLGEYLQLRNKKVFYFHAVQDGLASKIARFFSGKNKNHESKSVTKASWLQIQLRKLFLAIDIFLFQRLLKKLEKENYDYVLSDRYFFDSIINIQFLEGSNTFTPIPKYHEHKSENELKTKKILYQNHGNKSLVWGCMKNFPKPSKAFFLDVDPNIIMQRERAPDQGLEYLEKKRELFKNKIREWNMVLVGGEKDTPPHQKFWCGGKEEIFGEILKGLDQ